MMAPGRKYDTAQPEVVSNVRYRCSMNAGPFHSNNMIYRISMVSFQVIIWVYFFALCLSGSGDVIKIHTEDRFGYQYLDKYGIDIDNVTSLAFSIRAKNDAHVALSKFENNPGFETYEFVIGGWSNEKSVIRKCSQCSPMASIDHTPLDPDAFKQFWVSWGHGRLRVGNGSTPYLNEFLAWNDSDPHSVGYFGVSTGWDSNGTWVFNFVDGGWSSWADWTDCSATCGGGSRMRTRSCDNPEPLYGAWCEDPSSEVEVCNTAVCPTVRKWQTDWGEWGSCSETCDVGTRTRHRSCDSPDRCPDDTVEHKDCVITQCPIHGGWSSWSSWGQCDVTCANGMRTRSRVCSNPIPQYGGLPCQGDNMETEACYSGDCPVHGDWSAWGTWSGCTVTCGGGQRHRPRLCDSPPPSNGGRDCPGPKMEYETCNAGRCPVDGEWSAWAEWVPCTEECGGGQTYRLRRCNDPAPDFGGAECPGRDTEYTKCNEQSCPIDGGWSAWDEWGECSISCGGGHKTRHRKCDSPLPDYGGTECVGAADSVEPCSETPCPVNGEWSEWGEWSLCSVTCGGGNHRRLRHCDSPAPNHGGLPCAGDQVDEKNCSDNYCPVDGGWSSWDAWSNCSANCGFGTRNRSRTCDDPAPAHGGAACVGPADEDVTCFERPCPVNGGWSTWSPWSAQCTVTCAGGLKVRRRVCDNPAPDHGGRHCPGNGTDFIACNEFPCPVDGGWSAWDVWTPCSVSCGNGTKTRNRTCDDPIPKYGGDNCSGLPSEIDSCNETSCPVDGGWSPWSMWTACTKTCSTGNTSRSRSCTDPPPAHGGQPCPGEYEEMTSCSERECPVAGNWSDWSPWTPCSRSCGWGNTIRQRECSEPPPAYGGPDCPGNSTESTKCLFTECPVDGSWTIWSPWSQCTASCGGGLRQRVRECTNPIPEHGGNECPGNDVRNDTCMTELCPVDGAWSRWTHWLACSVECGGGFTYRTRTCDNPLPKNGGLNCTGLDLRNRSCNIQDCEANMKPPKVELEPTEAPGAVSIGIIGLAVVAAMVGAFAVLDIMTLPRHIAFMKANLRHCWSKVTGKEIPPKRKSKKRKKTTKQKLNRDSSVLSNDYNISLFGERQGHVPRLYAPLVSEYLGEPTVRSADLNQVEVKIENGDIADASKPESLVGIRSLKNNINIPHPNDLSKEAEFNTMARRKLESKYQQVLEGAGVGVHMAATKL